MRLRRVLRNLWLAALIALYLVDRYESRRRARFWRWLLKEDREQNGR